ncbi:MAG: type II and III secretion system protein family protein [Gammaproteobacteria bacterium]
MSTRTGRVLGITLAAAQCLAYAEPATSAAVPQPKPLKVRAGQAAPQPVPVALRNETGPRCTGEAARPAQLTLARGKSSLMRLPEAVVHRSVGDATVVQAMLVSPDTLYLLGVDVGTTNMIIQGKSGSCSVVELTVQMDVSGLQAALAAALPDEKDIKVTPASESVVLTGVVSDGETAQRAFDLAVKFMHQPLHALLKKGDDAGPAESSQSTNKVKYPPDERVVNMLAVAAPQQVLLEVKIAEVSKSLLERLEGGLTWRFSSGSWAATLLSNFLTGPTAALDATKSNGNRLRADASKQDGLVRILAEPNVMAISGQEGSFLAGGKIFIPVAQDNNKVTLEEKEFGVGLKFTPTVLAGGRINLRVAPEVSEISREGIGISAAGFTGAAILPLITSRRASTTVQLYDGQSFAIGGLIKNNMVSSLKGLPVLGEVPVLGALFRSTDYQQDRTELVFVVTAHLVKPLPANYTLPTDRVAPPGRAEMLLGGRLEGVNAATAAAQAAAAAPSPAGRGAATNAGFELK